MIKSSLVHTLFFCVYLFAVMGESHAAHYVVNNTNDVQQLEADLAATSQDKSRKLEDRVKATIALKQYSGSNALIAVARASRDNESQLRLAAIIASEQWSDVAKWDVVSPLLNDPNAEVQGAAIKRLLPLRKQLNSKQIQYMDKQIGHYIDEHLPAPSFEKAQIFIAQERYEEAFVILSQLANVHETREQALLLISEIYMRKGAYVKAQQHIEMSLKEYKKSAPFYYQQGVVYTHQKNYPAAKKAFYQAHQLSPKTERYLLAYASVMQRDSAKEASVLYRQLYALNANPQYLYASCQFQLEAGEDAQFCLSELAQIVPAKVVATLQ